MKQALHLLVFSSALLSACAGARLSHDEARKQIAAIGASNLIPDAIQIRRIVSQTETEAVAEATITLAFQFKRDKPSSDWRVDAVRLGDRDWISLDELFASLNETRRRVTAESMHKLTDGIAKYRERNGSMPDAKDIVGLTNMLHPLYMTELVREDAWGHSLDYEPVGGTGFRLVSKGQDGRRGTPDDIVLDGSPAAAP